MTDTATKPSSRGELFALLPRVLLLCFHLFLFLVSREAPKGLGRDIFALTIKTKSIAQTDDMSDNENEEKMDSEPADVFSQDYDL